MKLKARTQELYEMKKESINMMEKINENQADYAGKAQQYKRETELRIFSAIQRNAYLEK